MSWSDALAAPLIRGAFGLAVSRLARGPSHTPSVSLILTSYLKDVHYRAHPIHPCREPHPPWKNEPIRRQRMKAIRNRSGMAREQLRESCIIRAEDQRLARLLGKVRELAADGVEVGVIVEVLGIDVEHDGVLRTELGEGAIALIGFGDEQTRRRSEKSTLTPSLSPRRGSAMRPSGRSHNFCHVW